MSLNTSPPTADEMKRVAAEHAGRWIEDGMVVGLGTGSTIRFLLEYIARRRADGDLQGIIGVSTSEDTTRRAESLGIPLGRLGRHPRVDLTIDGADEVDPHLGLIKGLGGALLREKIVASASERLVIVVDASKRVELLGTRSPLPVEVDPFGAEIHRDFLLRLGCEPTLRLDAGGAPLVTDGGNLIYDCRFPRGINDPAVLDAALNARPGIVENGLFLNMADRVVIAGPAGTETLEASRGENRG